MITSDIFDTIRNSGCIAIDTCVIDYISRCEYNHAKIIMDTILYFENIVEFPTQVKSEMVKYFDSNKIQKGIHDILIDLDRKLNELYSTKNIKIRNKVISIVTKTINQLEKYAFGLYADALKEKKDIYCTSKELKFPDISDCILQAKEEYDNILRHNTVTRFQHLILENTFPNISTSEEINIKKDIDFRVSNNYPPGHGDGYKSNNMHGDIIIWNELKNELKRFPQKNILFITNDKKNKGDWYNENLDELHEFLSNEIINEFGTQRIYITDLHGFLEQTKPLVNFDIEELCEYISNHDFILKEEIDEYLHNNNNLYNTLDSKLNDIIYDIMADYCVVETYDYEIIDYIKKTENNYTKSKNNYIKYIADVDCSGDCGAAYHFCSEDEEFSTTFTCSFQIEITFPIMQGIYSKISSINYDDISCKYIKDSMDYEIKDPLEDPEEFNDDYYESDEDNYLDFIDEYFD